MKVLSIQQPWAWFIANRFKDIENRSWWTGHRGPTLIHAGKKFDKDGWGYIKDNLADILSEVERERLLEMGNITPRQIMEEMGGIVGVVDITGCVSDSPSPWFFGPKGFILENGRPLPLFPCKGKLGFFTPDEDGFGTYLARCHELELI